MRITSVIFSTKREPPATILSNAIIVLDIGQNAQALFNFWTGASKEAIDTICQKQTSRCQIY